MKLNPQLQHLPVYHGGRPLEEVARELGLPAAELIKLASNENPLGPSAKAVAAMREAAARVNLYPDGNAYYLREAVAEKLGITPANLIFGNGSNEIIEFVSRALLGPNTNIVVSQYCFAIYPIAAHLAGADCISVPARDFGHDLPAMREAITPETRIVFVANPNNPTGTRAPNEAVMDLVNDTPDDVLLVMDEAYFEFIDDAPDLLPLISEKQNLILMRTFSKIHGLAGLRVGYGIGHPDFIAALEKIRQPFNLNAIAQAAALAALEDAAHVHATRENNTEGLKFFENAFAEMDIETVPSHANFILVKVGDGKAMFEQLQQRGIITRAMGGYGLSEWIRISIGTPLENGRCLAALADLR
ncbi:MAG: histidinol-phosphate transaminase [Verrucomicrobia subdivision 3 bacterium]|nr:histidinol-phosphate transaminase [Limisphaerales bacterium]